MKKHELEHLLRAAGRIVEDDQFIVIGSQSLHAKFPDVPDTLTRAISFEADLIAKNKPERTEWLDAIGIDSRFHQEFGVYADPVDMRTAVLPKGWTGRLVNLKTAATEGVTGLCLDPHDLAISKYVARREKDIEFTLGLATHRLVEKAKLLALLEQTNLNEAQRGRIRGFIEADFASSAALAEPAPLKPLPVSKRRGRLRPGIDGKKNQSMFDAADD
jgi:hypothetical protein